MSAVSEIKTVTNIRDNMSAGLKAIQKEQISIKKEVQEVKEVLKGTFGKKWSIKLQSIELQRCLHQLSKEIEQLRKQLMRVMQGIKREKSYTITSIVKNSVIQNTTQNIIQNKSSDIDNEKPKISYPEINKSKDEGSGAVEGSSGFIDTAGDILSTILSGVGTAAESWNPIVGKIGVETGKWILGSISNIVKSSANIEQKEIYFERAYEKFKPELAIDEAKRQQKEYMDELMKSAAYSRLKTDDVLNAGVISFYITEGDTAKAMEVVRISENMATANPGRAASEAAEAIIKAKMGDFEALRGFTAVISEKEIVGKDFDEILQEIIAPQFEGAVDDRMKTTIGLRAGIESARDVNNQESGIFFNDIYKSILNYWYESELKEMNMTPEEKLERALHYSGGEKGKRLKNKANDQSNKSLNQNDSEEKYEGFDYLGGGVTGIGSIKNSINKAYGQSIIPIKPENKNNNAPNISLDRNGIFGMPKVPEVALSSWIAGTTMINGSEDKSNVTNVKNPYITINLNGANMAIPEMADKLARNLKMALENMGSQSGGRGGFGGELA